VKSVRCEIDFYKDLLLPDHQSLGPLFPKIYMSTGTPHDLDHDPMKTSFSIIMQDLSQDYIQKPSINEVEAKLVLDSLARLHAHYWNKVEGQPRGSFWVLEKRKAFNEVDNADRTWNDFVDRFPLLQDINPEIRKIGSILADKAQELDNIAEQGANTRIHGDAKGWNFFFSKDSNYQNQKTPFLFIDMQWTGRGHPLQDVAYALTTTLSEDTLDQMDNLVKYYVTKLDIELKSYGVADLNKTKMEAEYDSIWLDYARVIVTGLWKRLNTESLEKNKTKVGPSMINRSMSHVLFITRRLARLLL